MKVYGVIIGLVAVAGLLVSGCDRQNPVAPLNPAYQAESQGEEPVMFAARVETTDQNTRMLTFAAQPDTVCALQNCEIVRLKGGVEAPIPFNQIHKWDSTEVYGNREANGYVYAYKLCVVGGGECDVAFRDTIATIDYAAGSFTVAGRSETITTDEATLIWATLVQRYDPHRETYEHQWMMAQTSSNGPGYHYMRQDTLIAFTDLQVGDVVEVRANTVDETTLLAVRVKVVYCGTMESRCETFEAEIATLDLDTRTVTFVGLDWVGIVCNKAILTDADGLPITLEDFAVGDMVWVKGFPLEDGTLKICQMALTAAAAVAASWTDEATVLPAGVKNQYQKGGDRITFTAEIATLDLDTRTVTFVGLDWVGLVCNNAVLTDAAGVIIAFEDFAVGDMVSVKGYLLEDGTLKIGQMAKI